jgi:ankyrin repeat protein
MRIGIVLIAALFAACGQRTGSTTLIGAARNGDVQAIRALADGGADLDERGGVNGWPPLMHAIHKNQKAAVAALLDAGADPNERAGGGSTPLIMAAGYGYVDIVRLLLARGADPRMVDAHGDSALTAAVSGVLDIDKFTLGSCQSDTVNALLDAAPDLKVSANLWGRMARLISCTETRRALGNKTSR